MVRPTTIVNSIVSLLRSNLTDINKTRRSEGRNWIFDDLPRMDATFPRIGVFLVDGICEPIAIGTADARETARIQVSVYVGRDNKFDYDNDGVLESATDTVDYISDLVISTLQDNQATFLSDGAYHVRLIGEVRLLQEGTIQHNLDFEAVYHR